MEAKASLDSPRVKVSWAKAHIESFNEAARVFVETYSNGATFELNSQTGQKIWRCDKEVPIEFSLRVGDILYNLRSALDHLVWQLVIISKNSPRRTNAFPICDSPSQFRKQSKGKLWGVMPEAVTLIESLQPCNGGDSHLLDLDRFHNMDKHRHFILTMIWATGGKYDGEGISVERVLRFPPAYTGIVERGTILQRISSQDMDVNFSPTINIILDKGVQYVAVSDFMLAMWQAVNETVEKFHHFFNLL